MNRQLDFLDIITILSFVVGVYALEIALDNLQENEDQNDELKQILHYLDAHLEAQDHHLKEQDLQLASQGKILENLTR